ncbi:MAG TPA: crossover junction endodeoxyribonuclease RuvC [Candidatus Hydrogenedentes bacterium]|nr:crossover junction endodeoxyribonuclease RuvC [Candidatus Hydrogenedentota bacterium]HNT87493.1 crossover junction endodeoxyribonuclease RuvC [Candidatus Hydrogenedentota bacterium]
MRALGFDPGTATTGYGVVDGDASRLRHVAHGIIATPADEHFALRLKRIHDEARELIRVHRPNVVVVERIYFKQNVTTGIAVAQARGVLALAAVEAGLPVAEYSPTEVKTAIVGYGRAEKRQVQEMIKILLNLDAPPKPDDAADALGLAICQVQAGALQSRLRE